MFSTLFENAKQDWHLATKVETGVSWEALGIPWDELGRPRGAKSYPELMFSVDFLFSKNATRERAIIPKHKMTC